MEKNIDIKDIRGFVKELAELTARYDIVIGACGCCYGPYLWMLGGKVEYPSSSTIIAKSLKFDANKNLYSVHELKPGQGLFGDDGDEL